jgi:hypothetical protein
MHMKCCIVTHVEHNMNTFPNVCYLIASLLAQAIERSPCMLKVSGSILGNAYIFFFYLNCIFVCFSKPNNQFFTLLNVFSMWKFFSLISSIVLIFSWFLKLSHSLFNILLTQNHDILTYVDTYPNGLQAVNRFVFVSYVCH